MIAATQKRLERVAERIRSGKNIRIAIIGLGSVGNYLLDYLLSWPEETVEIHVAGRNAQKLESDVNIARVANAIRFDRTKKIVSHTLDLDDIDSIAEFFRTVDPDFTVNSSRAYSGVKYGGISWNAIRAYGLWVPLAMRYIRNIMSGYARAGVGGMIINTSYPDAANAWLRHAGLAWPDFGSGNLNHLIPRIKFAAAGQLGTSFLSELEATLATSHFHDVVISKEGRVEGVEPLLSLRRDGRAAEIDRMALWRDCAIAMPADAKRNMMNAGSNFEIISKIVASIREGGRRLLHIPGMDGELGGYPVRVDFRNGTGGNIGFDEEFWSVADMRRHNRESIYRDGIEGVDESGTLAYTDELVAKVKNAFGVSVPKHVTFEQIDAVGTLLIDRVIRPNMR